MKKVIKKEMCVCDGCGSSDSVYNHCKECGKDFCYDCKGTRGIEYQHAINCSGSGDGFYCLDCDAKLRESGDNILYNSYQEIKKLKAEEQKIYREMKGKRDWAELQVKIALGR